MLRVIKVGGSLLDWHDLPAALNRWLSPQTPACNVLICGGGSLADCIREADNRFALGDELAHWLAVDCMAMNARLLDQVCHFHRFVERYDDLRTSLVTETPCSIVLDVRDFLRNIEPTLGGSLLPHDWTATSDSIAARLAQALRADELVLLKSISAPMSHLAELAIIGYVDPHFPCAAEAIPPPIYVNLRAF